MSGQRLCTEAELEAMARPPALQMKVALESGDREAAKRKYDELEDAFFGLPVMFQNWIAYIQEFILNEYGHDALTRMVPLDEVFMISLKLGVTIEQLSQCSKSHKEEMAALIDAGDVEGAKNRFAFLEQGFRNFHDLYNGWTSLLHSRIYREYGLDALEQCHRFAGGKHWMPWMMMDIAGDPVQRVQYWSLLMHGHLMGFTIEEEDETFTMNLHSCGGCGRQLRAGYHEPPINLAIINEEAPATWKRAGTTAYQTHLSVIHGMMAIEQLGAPWPVIICNGGRGPKPCQIILYKNPRTAAPEHYAMVGKQAP